MSSSENAVRDVWVDLDLRLLPSYETFRQNPWYDKVDWLRANDLARSLIRGALADGAADVPQHIIARIPRRTPKRVREGTWSFFAAPIVATPSQITNGGHRISAMRRQGLERTVGVMAVDDDFDLASDPRVFPGQWT